MNIYRYSPKPQHEYSFTGTGTDSKIVTTDVGVWNIIWLTFGIVDTGTLPYSKDVRVVVEVTGDYFINNVPLKNYAAILPAHLFVERLKQYVDIANIPLHQALGASWVKMMAAMARKSVDYLPGGDKAESKLALESKTLTSANRNWDLIAQPEPKLQGFKFSEVKFDGDILDWCKNLKGQE